MFLTTKIFRRSFMDAEFKVGIQGQGSSSLEDLSILAGLIKQHTGITMVPVCEDSIPLRLEWLKNGEINFM